MLEFSFDGIDGMSSEAFESLLDFLLCFSYRTLLTISNTIATELQLDKAIQKVECKCFLLSCAHF